MHWPIGAPRLYEQAIPSSFGNVTLDGLHERVQDGNQYRQDKTVNENLVSPRGGEGARQVYAPTIEEREGQEHTPEEDSAVQDEEPSGLEDLASDPEKAKEIIGIRVTRNGHSFATITATSITIWQTKVSYYHLCLNLKHAETEEPTAVVASVERSFRSIHTYGRNIGLLLRPDGTTLVVHTSRGFLITYTIIRDFDAPAYQLMFPEADRRHVKRRGINHFNGYGEKEENSILDGSGLFHKSQIRFRMAIKIDAGIKEALSLDDEIVVATRKPAAVQCIKWTQDRLGTQSGTQLLRSIKWLHGQPSLKRMIYDKPMSLFTWITSDGQAYAVQQKLEGRRESQNSSGFFNGHIFHKPETNEAYATHAAINSRFSLIAVGCASGTICIYNVRDYSGGITLLKDLILPVSSLSSGKLTTLSYSPDGYCLFAGYERGWNSWSVYGQTTGSSFGSDRALAVKTDEIWLTGVQDACWMASGLEVALVCPRSYRIYVLEFARSAVAGCFTSANIERGLLQTSDGLMIYQGHDASDLTVITGDVSLWLRAQYPIQYLLEQWPIRTAVVSQDGRYLAIAGQRGLAHYSITSGRWKTFEDPSLQDEFSVRGGMCWYHHVLIAAVESSSAYEVGS